MSCDMMNKGDISIKDGLRPGDRPYINCPSIWTTSYFINGCILHCTYLSYHPVHFHKATFTSKLHCATLNIQSMSPMCVLYRLSCSQQGRLDRLLLYSSQPRVKITSMPPLSNSLQLNSNQSQDHNNVRITSNASSTIKLTSTSLKLGLGSHQCLHY